MYNFTKYLSLYNFKFDSLIFEVIVADICFFCQQGAEQKYWDYIMHSLLGGVPDAHYLYPYSFMNLRSPLSHAQTK